MLHKLWEKEFQTTIAVVTADHQKVVHPQEDLKVDLLEDQKADLQEAVILTDPAVTQEPHVDLEHLEPVSYTHLTLPTNREV